MPRSSDTSIRRATASSTSSLSSRSPSVSSPSGMLYSCTQAFETKQSPRAQTLCMANERGMAVAGMRRVLLVRQDRCRKSAQLFAACFFRGAVILRLSVGIGRVASGKMRKKISIEPHIARAASSRKSLCPNLSTISTCYDHLRQDKARVPLRCRALRFLLPRTP